MAEDARPPSSRGSVHGLRRAVVARKANALMLQAMAFDQDGTLVDSAGGVVLALDTALHDADLPCFNLQRVRS